VKLCYRSRLVFRHTGFRNLTKHRCEARLSETSGKIGRVESFWFFLKVWLARAAAKAVTSLHIAARIEQSLAPMEEEP
jgi:hypothetical protein